ncbi:MAG: peroxiredoxin, partial [Armatimonadetes bacterium]|nr:peroxiredoxin [Armatimonadota bacterium]
PGCTTEACGFRDSYGDLTALGAAVVGVSRDSVKSHQSFTTKYGLPFLLLADTDEAVCRAYGVLGEKMFCGKKVFGVIRTTVVIDGQGTIRARFDNVKVKGHVDEVLAAVKAIAA